MKPKATTSKTPRAPHVPVAAHPSSVPNVAPVQDDVREAEQPFAEGAPAPRWTPTDFMLKGTASRVLFGDPAKPGADVFLKLPAKSKVPPHKHTSVERIVLVEGDLSLTYSGHKPLTLKRGTYHYGTAYLASAGLLNYLVALNAFDIAKGRKM